MLTNRSQSEYIPLLSYLLNDWLNILIFN